MPAITIRNLSDETHRALKLLASLHGRSTEAEVRRILDEAVRPRTGLGTALARIGQELGGVEPRQRRSVDLVCLDLCPGDGPHLQRVGNSHPPHERCEQS